MRNLRDVSWQNIFSYLGISRGHVKDGVVLASARIIFIFLQMFILKISVHYLSNFELGIYYFLSTISYSLNALIFVPLDYYQQARIYPLLRAKLSLKSLLVLNVTVFKWILSISAVVVVVTSFLDASKAFNLLIAAFFSFVLYGTTALRSLVTNLEHKQTAAILMVIEGILRVLFIIIFFRIFPEKGATLIGANAIALLCSLMLLLFAARRLNIFYDGPVTPIKTREVAVFGWPLAISTCLYWIQTQGYRLILVPLGLTELVGIYATVSGVGASGMTAVSSVYSGLFAPELYKSSGASLSVFIKNGLLLIVSILLVSICFSGFFVTLLTKPEFVKYSLLILFGVVAEGCTLFGGGLSIAFSIRNRMHALPLVSLIGMISMGLILFLLYLLGILNIWTIGLPVVLSQVISVVCLRVLLDRNKVEVQSAT